MAEPRYLEFKLDIGPGSEGRYPLAVLTSPAGQARETLLFPLDDFVIDSLLERIQMSQRAGPSSRSKRESGSMPARDSRGELAREFGQQLFKMTFTGEIQALYDSSLQQAVSQDMGLRLSLSIRTPELAALPWEFLYDPRRAEYLSLSPNISIIRHLEGSGDLGESVAPPLKILAMIASPDDLPPLDAESEVRRLLAATYPLQELGLVEVMWVVEQTLSGLQQAIWSGEWHAFHFVGYGGFDERSGEDLVILADDQGRSEHVNAMRLGRILGSHPCLKLVMLTSGAGVGEGPPDRFCSMAARLVERGVPSVVALPSEMAADQAITFMQTLYESWAAAEPLEQAVAEARSALDAGAPGSQDWAIPTLYTPWPNLAIFEKETVAEVMARLGNEALQADEFDLAVEQLAFAAKLDAGLKVEEKRDLAKTARQKLDKARQTLKYLDGSTKDQADEIVSLVKDLETLDRLLPESRAIQIELARARERACLLRDHLWQEGQHLMTASAIGFTLKGRRKRTEKAIHLLQEAIRLDFEGRPVLQDDLSVAKLRLDYLAKAHAQSQEKRGRRLLVYGSIGAALVVLLLVAWLTSLWSPTAQQVGEVVATQPIEPSATVKVVALAKTAQLPSTEIPEASPAPADTATEAPSPLPPVNTVTVAASPIPATSTSAPTSSPVPPPTTSTPAPSPTAAPTETSPPTPTTEPTETAVPSPTVQPTEPTPEEAAAPTLTVTTETTVALTANLPYAAPSLQDPEDISLLSQGTFSSYPLRWQWAGALKDDEWFDVRIWPTGMPHYGVAWTQETEYLYDLCLQGSGDFYWSVAVVRGDEGVWFEDLSPEAEPHRFTSLTSANWCESHGRYSLPPR